MNFFKLTLAALLVSSAGHAYTDGTYSCKSQNGVTRTVVIRTVNLTPEISVPYMELTYTYENGEKDLYKGIATVRHRDPELTGSVAYETLSLGGDELNFDKGVQRCH